MENSSTISNLEEEIKNLSHEDLCEITLSTLRRLLASDKLLSDLPADVTTEEVNSQIAVVQGQSITVQVLRNLDTPLNVVIPQQNCTVRELKRAIQRAFQLRQQRSRSRSKISWGYIWRTYHLRHEDFDSTGPGGDAHDHDIVGPVMTNDQAQVSLHGVRNKSRLTFVKRLRSEKGYRSGVNSAGR